jgi:hypothetical protein
MKKSELLEKLRKQKSVPASAQEKKPAAEDKPNPVTAATATDKKEDKPAGDKPAEDKPAEDKPAAEGDLGKVIEALTALSEKVDMMSEALATILEGKADDKPEAEEEEVEEEADGKEGDEDEEKKPVDEMDEEEMEKELEEVSGELASLEESEEA